MKNKQSVLTTIIYSFILCFALLFLDQFTKHLTSTYLKDAPIILWEDVLSLRYVENRGVAFGMFQGKIPVILILNIVVLMCILALLFKLPVSRRTTPARIVLIFTIAGAFGNIIDRIRLGYVVDMISFDIISFPVFNVADIYVTCSVIVFAILYIFYYKGSELEDYLFKNKQKEIKDENHEEMQEEIKEKNQEEIQENPDEMLKQE